MPHASFLVPNLGYTGAAKQVSLLAPEFVRAGHTAEVVSYGGIEPFGHALSAHNVSVLSPFGDSSVCVAVRLMKLAHVFGFNVLRRVWWSTIITPRPRIVLSLTGHERLKWFDRRLLRIVSGVIVPHQAAAESLARQGVSNLTAIPPAVGEPAAPLDRDEFCQSIDVRAGSPLIVTVGRMDTRQRLFDALWGFEFLRYVDEAARLLIVGDGPGRERMQAAALGLAPEGSRVHFLGARPDATAIIGIADLVVIPQTDGGINVALEAMAAGKAVIAANTPDLASVIRDGETGLLVPPRNPPETARAMRRLLRDPTLRDRLGNAARLAAAGRSAATTVQSLESIYWA
jgi:glycosyltransferase involved in cell wall biosynthesis